MKTKSFLFPLLILSLLRMELLNANQDPRRFDKSKWAEPIEAVQTNLAPINYLPQPSIFTINLNPGFATDSYVIGPEISTTISGFYDYKTNGESNHYIQVDPSAPLQLHAIDVTADTTDPTGATTRRTNYAVSTNGGADWFALGEVPPIRSGYPVLKLFNGAAVISNHGVSLGVLNTNVYVDAIPQGGVFQVYDGTLPFSIWPQIEVLSDNTVGVLSRPQHISGSDFDTLFFQKLSGGQLGPKSIMYVTTPPYIGTVGSNARYNLASNGAGRLTLAVNGVLEDDTLANSKIWYRTSTDNGTNWGPLELLFSPFMEGNDTVAVAGGSDLVYKPGTNLWLYAFAATSNNTFAGGRLYLVKSDGSRSVITTVSAVGGATEFAQAMSFVFTLDQPSLGWSADGTVLYCTYAVVKPDLGTSGYNSRDVYYQASFDNGTTWSPPVQITNTPLIDECYASASFWNKGSTSAAYELNFTYMKDPGVGPSSFGGSAPPSRNFQIYRKITDANVIGISNNSIIADGYELYQNFPNPFNPATTIKYSISGAGFVSMKIYDAMGREVSSPVSGIQNAGIHEVNFNAEALSSGVYYYKITVGNFSDVKKMILIR